MAHEHEQMVIEQVHAAQAKHPALELVRAWDGSLLARGTVGFSIHHEGVLINDAYQVEISLPARFPRTIPTAREAGGEIPIEFHQFIKSGNLCLGAPVEVKRAYAEHKSLLGFIDRQMIPYLFAYSFFRDHGRLPWGDLRHGYPGILDYYREFFGTGILPTLRLLKYLADFEFLQSDPCPCESGRDLCMCHGRKVLEVWGHQSPDEFAVELLGIMLMGMPADKPLDELWWAFRDLVPKGCSQLFLQGLSDMRKAG